MREWALDRWSENTQVDLTKELLRLKAEIKIEREVEEQAQQERDQKELVEDCTSLADLQVQWRTFISKSESILEFFSCSVIYFIITSLRLLRLHRDSRMYRSGPQFFLVQGRICLSDCTTHIHIHIPQIWHQHHQHFFNTHPLLPPSPPSPQFYPFNMLFFKRNSKRVQLSHAVLHFSLFSTSQRMLFSTFAILRRSIFGRIIQHLQVTSLVWMLVPVRTSRKGDRFIFLTVDSSLSDSFVLFLLVFINVTYIASRVFPSLQLLFTLPSITHPIDLFIDHAA